MSAADLLQAVNPTDDATTQQKAIGELVLVLQEEIGKRFDERDLDLAKKVEKMIDGALPGVVKKYRDENPDFGIPGLAEEKQVFSMSNAVLAIAQKNPALAPYEMECFKEMNRKYGDFYREKVQVSDSTGQLGQFLVPEEHANELIDILYADSVSFQLGARAMPNQFGELAIPVLRSGVTATWLAENTAVTPADLVYSEHTMRPRQLMAATEISNVLLANSRPTAEGIIRDHFSEQFRVAIDTAILSGSGTGAEPFGITNTTNPSGEGVPGAVDLTGTGNAWTYAAAMEFITDVASADGLRGSLGWAMDPVEFANAVQMPSGTTNVDVNRLVVSEGTSRFILGYPVGITTILANGGTTGGEETIIFGDWSQVRVPFWKTLELRASDVAEDVFYRNVTAVRGVLYADISIDHLQSFSIGSSDNTN